VRSTVSCIVAILVLGAAGIFSWQRSQIVHLREQVARQGDVLDDLSLRADRERASDAPAMLVSTRARAARPADVGLMAARADERRVILNEYRDVLAQMNLAPETAARLQDLLTDRVETVLDAQDAAIREGFAEGSAQMARAVGLAIAEENRDIVGLVGQDGMRRIDGYPAPQQQEPAAIPLASAPVVVNVVVQAPAAPLAAYPETAAQAEAPDSGAQYASYPFFQYYPIAAVVGEPRARRGAPGPRNAGQHLYRNIAVFAVR
jgi:hypothetical protein